MKKFKEISLGSWGRRAHYEFFMENFQFPHTTITAPMDVTNLVGFCKEKKLTLFNTTVFIISKCVNEIPEFRQRLRPETVLEWEKVHPSYTIMGNDHRFLFCDVEFSDDLHTFHERSVETARKLKEGSFQDDFNKDDNRIFLSCLPWISFTQMSHPIHSARLDATPRISWGKVTQQGERYSMPLNMQAHHALVDGYHLGLAFEGFQKNIEAL
ncbi:MAG: hypothetical protein A2X86_03075 [Bdellovibrionales bacterium GWA2_49_15]|nr:MAG: hypothetical protein A2X86_03075 [Bdellovibrionales bacterium GWA2_49_15]HAZ12196.1 chloramphenicol acetyltransferase [Bdellovibrionales bacterium]